MASRACATLVSAVSGCTITTIEGLTRDYRCGTYQRIRNAIKRAAGMTLEKAMVEIANANRNSFAWRRTVAAGVAGPGVASDDHS